MDADQFTPLSPGQLVRAAEGYPAFVPAAPPRRLSLSDSVVGLLDEASSQLGELRGIARLLSNPELLISPYLRREALLSSRIEGTRATMSDIFAAEVDQPELFETTDVGEILNYVTAQQWAFTSLTDPPLSLRLLRGIHLRLMTGVRGRERHPGEFRSYQNWIGGFTGEDATYVPPPVPAMRQCLSDLEAFMHREGMPPLIQAAVLHYQFEAIHPFGDGNGRVGRLFVPVFLAERGLLPQPLLYLSAYFERTREEYYARLMRVSTHGDWDGWLRYFLTGVRVQSEEAILLSRRIVDLHARYREQLQAARAPATVLSLIDLLFVNPRVTARRVQETLGVSAPTARKAIRSLVDAGILTEVTGRRWGTAYRASEVYAVAAGDEQ